MFSSRRIARKLRDDVAFRVLAAGNFPAHRTIRAFRLQELSELFVQVVRLAREMVKGQIDALRFDPERSPGHPQRAPIRAINDSRPGARSAD